MKFKVVTGITLALLIIGTLTLAFNIAVPKPVLADSLDLGDVTLEAEDTRNAYAVFADDVDGDGDTEIVTGSALYPSQLRIWRWDGTTLTLEKENSTTGVLSVFCSDVDADGDTEIVTGGYTKLRVWRWNGTELALEKENSTTSVYSVFCNDVDADGDVEIVTGGTDLRIWQWNGTTLTLEKENSTKGVSNVFCGDVDADGDVEIVTGGGDRLRVWLWNGTDLTLEIDEGLSILNQVSAIYSVFASDVDADGDTEIVTGGYREVEIQQFPYSIYKYYCELLVWHYDGTTLTREASTVWGEYDYSDYSIVYSVFCSDVDGDGNVEIVTGGKIERKWEFRSWSKRNNTLLLENYKSLDSGAVESVFCGDVDGDGQTEIVTGDVSGLRIWSILLYPLLPLNLETSQELPVESYLEIEWFESIFCGDVDGDGKVEIVTGGYTFKINRYYGIMRVWNWNGTTLTLEASDLLSEAPIGDTRIYSVFANDVDSDGDVEIVAVGDDLVIWRWNGTDLTIETSHGWSGTKSVFCDDVDMDGDVEIVAVGDNLVIGCWNGTDLTIETYRSGWGANSVFCGDVDMDGDVEIVTVETDTITGVGTEGILRVRRWNGTDLTLEKEERWTDDYTVEVHSVFASDVDDDGDTEIITGGRTSDGTYYNGQLRIWQWNGTTLTLESSKEWATTAAGSTEIYSVICGNVDEEGDIEIITGGLAGPNGQLRVWCWNGTTITPKAAEKWPMGVLYPYPDTGVKSVFCGDVDGDSEVEIVTGGTWDYYLETEPGGGYIIKRAQLRIWGPPDLTPPTIGTPSQNPTEVEPYQSVNVTVEVTDEGTGVREVILSYSTDEGQTWTNLTMNNTERNTYVGEIPGFEADIHVQYKIIAYDNASNPAVEDNNEEYYVYTVIPEFPSALILPLLMIITLIIGVLSKGRKILHKE